MNKSFLSQVLSVVAISAALSLSTNTANATLIAYEGFDYAVDTGLASGLNGGYGWGNSWVTASGSQFATNVAGSLSYPGVSTIGNSDRVGVASDLSQGNPGTLAPQRNLPAALGTYGSTIWIGMLWQNLTDSTQGLLGYRETKFGMFSGANPASLSRTGTERVDVGIPHTYTAGFVDQYSLYSGATQVASGVATLRGTDPANTVFLLLKMTLDGTTATDNLSMWVNPNIGLGEGGLGAANAQWTANDLDIINGFRFQVASSNASGINGQILVDELRIGTAFENAVAGVPEPGVLAVLGVGLSAMIMAARRKRS